MGSTERLSFLPSDFRDRVMLAVLWVHVPIIAVFSTISDHEPWHEPVLALILCCGVTVAFMRDDPFRARMASAVTLMVFSGMLIHLNDGRIEYHFHVFAALALISLWNDWRPVWAAGAVIAVHHVVLNFVAPYDVFAEGPSLFTVTLHAVFVVLTCCALTVGAESARRREVRLAAADSANAAALTELRELSGNIVVLVDRLSTASGDLSTVSQGMSSTAEETAAQANVVAAAAEQVDANVQTVVAGTEQMAASISGIAENAAEAARVATRAVRVAESTNSQVGKLGESSAEIGQVIKVITSIAQQTNLLALNATIEATRAGDAGRGFAVVAHEVKELARETARATEDISTMIEAIQKDTRGAVEAIGEISSIIEQINAIQTTISYAVEEQTSTTNEIGRSVTEAATGTAEIARNIAGVASAAEGTTEGAGHAQLAAVQLAAMAEDLRTAVARFAG